MIGRHVRPIADYCTTSNARQGSSGLEHILLDKDTTKSRRGFAVGTQFANTLKKKARLWVCVSALQQQQQRAASQLLLLFSAPLTHPSSDQIDGDRLIEVSLSC